MSVAAVKWALRQAVGSSSAKFVLMVLAEHADDAARCFPSQALIAEETELSERSVRTQLRLLEDAGLIRRTHQQRGDGSRTADTIELATRGRFEVVSIRKELPQGQPEAPSANRKHVPDGQPENDDRSNRNVFPIQPEARSGLTTFEPPVEPPEEPPVSGAPTSARSSAGRKRTGPPTEGEIAEFEAWWLLYPLKKGKQAALGAFVRVRRDGLASIELLTERGQAYAGERAGKDPRFTAHGATWLPAAELRVVSITRSTSPNSPTCWPTGTP